MELGEAIQEAFSRLRAAGRVEVRENGAWLAALEPFEFELRPKDERLLLHLWSAEASIVWRVVAIVENERGRLLLDVARQARRGTAHLEFIAAQGARRTARIVREQFRTHFADLLARRFPDEKLASLTTAADLEHSLSGNYARGVLEGGAQSWAVLGAAPEESAATYDGILTFGLVWLDRAHASPRRKPVAGLRLFLPEGFAVATAHRMRALSPTVAVELYEYQIDTWSGACIDPRDLGNVSTRLLPRREVEALLAQAAPEIARIRRLAPHAITAEAIPDAREVLFRFRGLAFARWDPAGLRYGLNEARERLTPDREQDFARLLRDLEAHRSPVASARQNTLYRAQPERWLQALVAEDVRGVDARLDPKFVYSQVSAVSGGERGVMDLLTVTRDGRLALLELKADEDIHLVLQAASYWLRISAHHEQQELQRYGYFPKITLDPRPPLLFLVAPALRFHPASDVLLRGLKSEIEVCRVGVSETWRRGLRAVLRQGRSAKEDSSRKIRP